MKTDVSKVHPKLADEALKRANGERTAAYSNYIKFYYRCTGKLAPGCDNADLQEYYKSEVEKE